jgi:hypothetical protein
MDVFKIEQSIGGGVPSPDKITPEVSFDAGSEFNLSFFDTDSNTQGFSDPGSVGSTSASSPPPLKLTPLPGTSAPSQGLLSPPAVKQGIHASRFSRGPSDHANYLGLGECNVWRNFSLTTSDDQRSMSSKKNLSVEKASNVRSPGFIACPNHLFL